MQESSIRLVLLRLMGAALDKKLLIVPTTAGEYTSGATFSVNNETYTITTKADKSIEKITNSAGQTAYEDGGAIKWASTVPTGKKMQLQM